MYLKELLLELPPDSTIEEYKETELPLELLQLTRESSLLHGLGNRETAP